MSKLSHLIDVSVGNHADKSCLADKHTRLSFSELYRRVCSVAGNLDKAGVKPGDNIALYSDNRVEYIVVYLALIRMGAIVIPIDFSSSEERIRYILGDCGIKMMISRKDFIQGFPCLTVFSGELFSHYPGEFLFPEPEEEDLACILYTTGSTGHAKGVILTHANVFASLNNISEYMGYSSTNRELVALPLTHSFGLNQVLVNLMNGGFAYLVHGFSNSGRILRLLQSESITNFPGTPTSFKMMLDNYLIRFRESTGTLRTILINSSPLPPKYAEFLLHEFPDVTLQIYYGLTEASRSTFHTHSLSLSEKHLSSVGKAAPNIEVAIMNDSGELLPEGKPGEVVVRGKTIMKGYWNKPEETEQAMHLDWFRTGDLGFLDSEGYLFLTGRLKDQINIGGLKTSSMEIKTALEELAYVKEAFVFGMEHEVYGEVPVACIEFQDNPGREKLIRDLEMKLDNYKIPHQFFHVKLIPKSLTGKVLKAELIEFIKQEEPIA